MSKIAISLLFSFVLFAFITARSQAQTINAASCSSSDVSTALSSVSTNGTTVNIPSCSSGVAWTSTVTYTVNYSMTIAGAGSQTTVGGGDATVLEDSISGSGPAMLSLTLAAGTTLRITGITIEAGSRTVTNNGSLQVYCNNTPGEFRMDHSHIKDTYTGMMTDNCFGVLDHNVFDETTNNDNYLHVWNQNYNQGASSGEGDGSWATGPNFGTADFMYIESNTINYGVDDCTFGGRVVARFNTLNYGAGFQTHPTGGGGPDERGCRAYEVYQNSVGTGLPATSPEYNFFWLSSGTALVWGNNTTGAYSNFITLHSMRRDNSTYSESATPNGWGYCGTSFNGTGSAWDENSNSSTGFRCIDQPGNGIGNLITGVMPNAVNSTTGKISWLNQAVEPVYSWNNTWSSDGGCGGCSEISNQNSDVLILNGTYYDSTISSSCSGSSCTSGIGSGTLASRPSSCTVNTLSDGATSGVAYWATDQGSWNNSGSGGQGELFVCTATNTWTPYYTPYTYPHPLTQSSGSSGNTVAAPTGLSATVSP